MKFLTKVVPISKSIEGDIDTSYHWNTARSLQGYLYCKYYDMDMGAYVCGIHGNDTEGDFFHESDLIPYEEPKAKESGKGMFVELKTGTETSRIFNLNHITCVEPHNEVWCRISLLDSKTQMLLMHSYESIKQLLTDKELML